MQGFLKLKLKLKTHFCLFFWPIQVSHMSYSKSWWKSKWHQECDHGKNAGKCEELNVIILYDHCRKSLTFSFPSFILISEAYFFYILFKSQKA